MCQKWPPLLMMVCPGSGNATGGRSGSNFSHLPCQAGSWFLFVTLRHGMPVTSPVRSPSQQLFPLPTCLSLLFSGVISRSPAVCPPSLITCRAF